jgi:hypothetical protein
MAPGSDKDASRRGVKMGVVAVAAALLVAGAGMGPAQDGPASPGAMLGFFDAATLSGFCDPAAATAREGLPICLSYITGAADQLLAEQAMGAPGERTICLPRSITPQAVMAAVNAYAGWTASAKGVSAAGFVKYALEEAYPCDAIGGDIM